MRTEAHGKWKSMVTAVALAAGSCLAVHAQPDPGDDPELTDQSVEQRSDELLSTTRVSPAAARPAEAPRLSPVRPHRPDAADGEGRLLPDGSFLVNQPGTVQVSPAGAWIFSPDADDTGEQARPMVVLPSQILGRLQRVVGEGGGPAAVRLTGRVTLFFDQNYLLISAIADQSGSTAPSAAEPDDLATDAGNASTPSTDRLSGAVDALIEDLEAERTGVRAVIAGIGSGDEAALAPVAEGRMISRRTGRLVRLDAGELAIAFDNDSTGDQTPPIDVPLVIAPCALLEGVEATLETHGDAMTATVSGQTLAFGGRSFILPISIVIDRPSELNSRQ
ncbi:MAG: hypothetical protein AAFN41_09880 [Planctomycetota bacterium]